MISPQREIEFVEAIYACLLGDMPWTTFMRGFEELLPNAKSNFTATNGTESRGSFHLLTGFEQKDVIDFNSHYQYVNPWMAQIPAIPVGNGLTSEELLPRSTTSKGEYYNDFMRPMEVESVVGVVIANEGSDFFLFNTMTDTYDMDQLVPVKQFMERIAPHLRRAFHFHQQGAFFGGTQNGYAAVLDEIGIGCLMLRSDGRVHSLNRTAENAIESGGDLGMDTLGKVRFRNPERLAYLNGLLTTRGPTDNPVVRSFDIPTQGDDKRYTIIRFKSDPVVEFMNGPAITILIEPRRHLSTETKLSRLGDRFRLTQAEKRVATAITEGLAVEEIAIRHGVSNETIRSQLKSIYGKMGISGQKDFLRSLL